MRLLERYCRTGGAARAQTSLLPVGTTACEPAERLFQSRQLDAGTLVTGDETFAGRVAAHDVGVLDLGEGRTRWKTKIGKDLVPIRHIPLSLGDRQDSMPEAGLAAGVRRAE